MIEIFFLDTIHLWIQQKCTHLFDEIVKFNKYISFSRQERSFIGTINTVNLFVGSNVEGLILVVVVGVKT